MERFYILAPALIPLAYILLMFGFFCVRTAMGYQPEIKGVNRRKFSELIGPFVTTFFLWLIRPIERACIKSNISPNLITVVSMAMCATAGIGAATGQLIVAMWAFAAAGMLDVLDGRLARATNRSSQAGAFLDSVSDRWGELFVFTGLAWLLRDTPWLAAVMAAIGASLMVSYTRARGEGFGLSLDGGMMQRAERIVLICLGLLIGISVGEPHTKDIIGIALTIVATLATMTGIGRWVTGYRILKERETEVRIVAHEGNSKVIRATERQNHELAATVDKHAA